LRGQKVIIVNGVRVNGVRALSIEEAARLRDELTGALDTFKRHNPPPIPANVDGYSLGSRRGVR
jgi:hypothetical protein